MSTYVAIQIQGVDIEGLWKKAGDAVKWDCAVKPYCCGGCIAHYSSTIWLELRKTITDLPLFMSDIVKAGKPLRIGDYILTPIDTVDWDFVPRQPNS